MTGLGSPLVVFRDTTLCDGKQHEVELVTDGTRGYASGGGVDLPLICRTDETVTVSCRVPDAGDEECHGAATFRLDTPCWLSVSLGDGPEALRTLDQYGAVMDR